MIIGKTRLPTIRLRETNTLSARIGEYLKFREISGSYSTYKRTRSCLNELCKYATSNNLRDLGGKSIARYFVDMVRRGKSPSTISVARAMLSGFFTWAQRMGYIDNNPMVVVPSSMFPVGAQKQGLAVTEDHYEAFKKEYEGTAMYYFVVCAWHTGMRKSDVATLRWDEVFLDEDPPMIRKIPIKTGRRSKATMEIPIHPELFALLSVYHSIRSDEDQYVSGELARSFFNWRLDKESHEFCRRRFDMKIPKGITMHSFRHAAIRRWMNHPNADVVTVCSMSGHSNPATLARYCKPDPKKKLLIMGIQNETQVPSQPQLGAGNHSPIEEHDQDDSTVRDAAQRAEQVHTVAGRSGGPMQLQ